jgi:hypothetical protein
MTVMLVVDQPLRLAHTLLSGSCRPSILEQTVYANVDAAKAIHHN